MEPRCSGQDVLRCDLCEDPGPSMYCDVCHISLCKACVGEHLSDESTEHKVVPFKKRGSTLTCTNHSPKICELYCEQCNGPICSLCVSSGDHEQHKKIDIFKHIENKKAEIKEDLLELENNIYERYQKFSSKISVQKHNMRENSIKLKSDISAHRDNLHREIDIFVHKLNLSIDEMDSQFLAAMNEKEVEYTNAISEINQSIADLKTLQDSKDKCHISTYQSRNERFRRLPTKLTKSLPIFVPNKNIQIHKQFGSVSRLSIKTEEEGYIRKAQSTMSIPPERTLIDVPRIIANTDILHGLRGISCVDKEQFWTCGDDNIMRLYNLHGELVQTIQTKSGILPWDIAVIKNGDLVYIGSPNFTVNIVKNTQIFKVIRQRKWRPLYVCCSSSGDFLVVMENVKNSESKVVRYSGSLETQSIQFDARGQLLYSKCSEFQCSKYIVENKNLDICVADTHENAIIVVNCAGELRFRYIDINKPTGITADSQGRILVAERHNDRIHILDQEGQFLRYIDNCGLVTPWSLSVDNDDKLLVMMKDSGNVKKIQYCL